VWLLPQQQQVRPGDVTAAPGSEEEEAEKDFSAALIIPAAGVIYVESRWGKIKLLLFLTSLIV